MGFYMKQKILRTISSCLIVFSLISFLVVFTLSSNFQNVSPAQITDYEEGEILQNPEADSTHLYPKRAALSFTSQFNQFLSDKTSTLKPKSITPLTGELYEAGFINANPSLCESNGHGVNLTVMITSAPGNFKAREAIRHTWGNSSLYNRYSNINVVFLFLLGRTNDLEVQNNIVEELSDHNDLVIGNSLDSYHNLTLKTMSSLEWLSTYCSESEYALKTDDDMFINIPNLLKMIIKLKSRGDLDHPRIYGRLGRRWRPRRDKKSKWYISIKQFNKKRLPDFTTGPAYLFSSGLAGKLFNEGMKHPYIPLEDVYTTGIIAKELKIPRKNERRMYNRDINLDTIDFCILIQLISVHKFSYEQQFQIWEMMNDPKRRGKCTHKILTKKQLRSISTDRTTPKSKRTVKKKRKSKKTT